MALLSSHCAEGTSTGTTDASVEDTVDSGPPPSATDAGRDAGVNADGDAALTDEPDAGDIDAGTVADAGQAGPGDCLPATAGNPFADGWYADPDMRVYDGVYWVYPTYSYPWGEQTFLDAFSSPDLVHWTKHERVFEKPAGATWIRGAIWAPAPIFRDGRYFLYFGANDYKPGDPPGGIGVAVADHPGGPFVDAIGAPLIGAQINGANPIDQSVFLDDDGQAYLYYGGGGHCNVVKLHADMKSLDASSYREITPEGYVEGSLMFKRNGTYYLMWSEGTWTGPDYRVSYAMADSPLGPFEKRATILRENSAIGTGSGHNTVVNVPGTDDWYIFYHRHPLGDADGNHRVLSYDRMVFAPDGTIQPVEMSSRDNFCDDNAIGWSARGGAWSVTHEAYTVAPNPDAKSLLNTNFASLTYEADVSVGAAGNAGLMFRVTDASEGLDNYRGYYVGIDAGRDRIVLGKANVGWTELASAGVPIDADVAYKLRVVAEGPRISVFLNDIGTATLTASDATFASGATGLRAHDTAAAFDNVSVSALP